jgi:hypothetical protein
MKRVPDVAKSGRLRYFHLFDGEAVERVRGHVDSCQSTPSNRMLFSPESMCQRVERWASRVLRCQWWSIAQIDMKYNVRVVIKTDVVAHFDRDGR